MTSNPDFEIKYFDTATREVRSIKKEDFDNRIQETKELLIHVIEKLSDLKGYKLTGFTTSMSLEAGFWVLKAKGSVSFTWKKS